MAVDPHSFERILRNLGARLQNLEVREAPQTANATVNTLPPASATHTGRLRYVTNARKVGEAPGAGTGTLAYDDGTAWRRVGDDTTISA